ncbi:MAG: Quinolinate synthase A [Dehalococcoidia bacterium]|nr:Quinolinate synthase A [Dehalococcoidia bacterium]
MAGRQTDVKLPLSACGEGDIGGEVQMPAITTQTPEEIARLQAKILELKKKLKAVIVAHNYQRPEVQDIADFVGDSLELSRKAKEVVDANEIIFCGVHFMAETAAILNPTRPVLLAEGTAGCPMADMIDAADLREWKEKYPRAGVVCYINTTAAVKAECDICCTSANAVGHYVSTKTKKKMILYPGFCITHKRLQAEQVRQAKEAHPEAVVLIHPECAPEVVALGDAVLSTSQMIRFAKESPAQSFLIGTEEGLLHRLKLENPTKTFYLMCNALVCPNMKRTTLDRVLKTMEEQRNRIIIPEDVRLKALRTVERMLAVV